MKIMNKNKKLLIALILVVLGGVLVLGIQYRMEQDKIRQEQLEIKRNKEYEEDLVQALKKSYRDIEEITILSSSFDYSKPGGWRAQIRLIFTDGVTIEYGIGHSLGNEMNRSAVVHPTILKQLREHFGETDKEIKVIYSDGREAVE